MPNRHDIHVLNTLIGATLDSAERLEQIAGDSESSGRNTLFAALAQERREMARTLSDSVTALGGNADGGSSILQKAQRAVQDISHALIRDESHALIRDEAGLVDAADRSETGLDRKFEAALADERISATTRETLRRAHAHIHRETAEVHDLRRSVDGQRDASSGLYPQ